MALRTGWGNQANLEGVVPDRGKSNHRSRGQKELGKSEPKRGREDEVGRERGGKERKGEEKGRDDGGGEGKEECGGRQGFTRDVLQVAKLPLGVMPTCDPSA